MFTSRRTRAIVLCTSGLLLLAGCGGSSKPKAAESTQSSSQSSSSSSSSSSNSSSSAAPSGSVEGFAGSGDAPVPGDEPGPALKVGLDRPENIAVTKNGDLYIADNNTQRILKVHDGTMTSLYTGDIGAGESNTFGMTLAPDDTVWFSNGSGVFHLVGTTPTKVITGDQIQGQPFGLTFDAAGNLYIAEQGGQRVEKYDTTGALSLLAGTGDQSPQEGGVGDGGPATAALLGTPTSVAVDKAGNVYVAENFSRRIRKITPDGIITTLAGGGTVEIGDAKDGSAGTDLVFDTVDRVAIDADDNVYVADHAAGLIVRFDSAGKFEHVAGSASGTHGDGQPALATALDGPLGMAFDQQGTLYFIDAHRVRRIKGIA